MKAWIALIVAGLLEVCWASALKSTAGFTKIGPTLFFVASLAASLFLLSVAAKHLPMGTAYAVWVGIGAAGTAVVAAFLHGESLTPSRALFLALLIVSIVGLKFASARP